MRKQRVAVLFTALLVLYVTVTFHVLAKDIDETAPPDSCVYYATYYATDFATQEEFEAALETAQKSFYHTNEEFLAANSDAEIGFYSNVEELLDALGITELIVQSDANVHFATDFDTQEEFEAALEAAQNGFCISEEEHEERLNALGDVDDVESSTTLEHSH